MEDIKAKLKESLNSVRVKLFLTLAITILVIIVLLITLNSFVLESFYMYSKTQSLKSIYNEINGYYQGKEINDIDSYLMEISIKNGFDIMISDSQNQIIFASNKDLYMNFYQFEYRDKKDENKDITIEENEAYNISKMKDFKSNLTYLILNGKLENGYNINMRIPITSIQESVKISNRFLYILAGFAILISGVMVIFISKKFAKPIMELNSIAKKMSNLDFSQKYEESEVNDEINDLGKSINIMSDKLERTIKQLRNTNIELEKDIEEKSKIDEMRKTFISDVSHELKTPIALIQGYSEGLIENVNTDEENRKFYAEVILDETNKMDRLVKQLLELMKLEYGKREFNNKDFNIVDLEKEVVLKSKVMLDEKDVEVVFEGKKNIEVIADDFYVEQVITNYLTNAIKNLKEIDGKKLIKISNSINKKDKKVRIFVYNTGNNLSDEEIARIWNRFYKKDESRNREDGGTGIGLAIVKAIMNNFGNEYGVQNKDNGVEFYFDLDLK